MHPGRKVILVTKDVNLRIKAKSLNLLAEDYETGKIKSVDELYTGNTEDVKATNEQIASIYNKGNTPAKPILKKGLAESLLYFEEWFSKCVSAIQSGRRHHATGN